MSTLKHNIGNLDKIKRIIKLTGYINCIDGFNQHPSVLNGCSDLMNKVLGEKGQHVRSCMGSSSLPLSVSNYIFIYLLINKLILFVFY
jgi:enamine deaminase RidA (YjgF/YER057c/UK114 family)